MKFFKSYGGRARAAQKLRRVGGQGLGGLLATRLFSESTLPMVRKNGSVVINVGKMVVNISGLSMVPPALKTEASKLQHVPHRRRRK